jgi:hypothetical protein
VIQIIYEFLFYFTWNNDRNAMDLTERGYIDLLFSQFDLDPMVARILTEVFVDNDVAN